MLPESIRAAPSDFEARRLLGRSARHRPEIALLDFQIHVAQDVKELALANG